MGVISFPAADLAQEVDLCWWQPCDGATGTAFQEFLPDSGVHLVLRVAPSCARMGLVGPATEKMTVELDRGAEYFGVRFKTGQAPRLADMRASELTNRFVELTRIRGMAADDLAEQLRRQPDLASKLRVLEELLRGGGPRLVRDERCRNAARVLEAHGGRLRVDELAGMVGLHVRSLERLFHEEFGIPPKHVARLVRLRQVLGALYAGGQRSLADVAHTCGYSDQSHMIHDFRALIGRRPGERESFRSRRLARAETRIVHRYRP